MDTRTIKVFKLQELGDDAFRRAIDDHREILVEFEGWWEPIYEGAMETLLDYGFEGVEIQFSGFGSQGDGASFTAKSINLDNFLMRTGAKDKYPYSENALPFFKVERIDSRYSHENTCLLRFDWDNQRDDELSEEEEKQFDALYNFIEEKRLELCKMIYKDLEHYYYDLTEEDAIADHLEANDYLFLENGERWHE